MKALETNKGKDTAGLNTTYDRSKHETISTKPYENLS